MKKFRVLIIMGSPGDMEAMQASEPYYEYFGIAVEYVVSSAHRDPAATAELVSTARSRGFSALVCGAGMAAHLAGMAAAHSDLPVIGVPLKGGVMDGLDALLATVQMPAGVPVATLAVGRAGAINSAVLCARIFALSDAAIEHKLALFRAAGSKLPEARQ